MSQGLPFRNLMVLDITPTHPHVLQDLHSDIKFVFLLPNTMQPMGQGVIRMSKAHYLQKTWHALSLKCDVSLDELGKAAQAPEKTEVELQKDVVQHQWQEYTIHDAIWHVHDVWKEVTESCIHGAWKKLCPKFAIDFRDFNLSERLLEERLKCLELVRKAGLNEIEEDVDSLLETISEELSTEELVELEKQRHQLEEEVEDQHRTSAPSTTKQLTVKILQRCYGMLNQTMDHLEEVDPDVEWTGLSRRKVMSDLAHYEQLPYKKVWEATQTPLDAFSSRASLPEASASDEPQPSTSTRVFTHTNVPSPSSSDIDDPDVV